MTQPEALRLADWLEHQVPMTPPLRAEAAAELRRLYEVNQELVTELYVYRASEYLKDVTAALKKIAEGK